MLVRAVLAGCVASLAFGHADSARAQALGNYAGTQANGASINFTVATDSSNGDPEITSFGLGIAGTCTGNTTVNTGIGVGFATDIVADKAHLLFDGNQTYFTAAVTFAPGGNTASGTITTYTVIFAPKPSGHPTKALFCHTGAQTFTVSLSSAAAVSLPAGMAVVHR